MIREYQRAIWEFPAIWLTVKLRAFYDLIRPSQDLFWLQNGISENDFGLVQNRLCQPVRESFLVMMRVVRDNPVLRVISNLHVVWMGVNVLGICLCVRWYVKRRQSIWLLGGILLSLPLSYYGSYLFATTAWDFRFMYPATLALQVLVFASGIRKVYETLLC